jgi:hypothetical protein
MDIIKSNPNLIWKKKDIYIIVIYRNGLSTFFRWKFPSQVDVSFMRVLAANISKLKS